MTKTTVSTLSAAGIGAAAPRPTLPIILKAGLLAGLLDIIAAFVSYSIKTGKNPLPILNYIASGVVGKETAYGDRVLMAIVGLLLHFLIATIFAAIFYYAWPLIRKVSTHWVVTGLGYGVLVWLAMNLVVVPMSNTPGAAKHTTSGVIIGMLILMFFVGLPIAYVIARRRV
ncbi:hypothetical protein [Paraflavitalea sp. CAU 1676]|uniref:hypothetical protein n=1 Tax=Paraflavitalea sp. CAU 1676 TaxID=3032598 RepID=UPI0023DB5973|nr:hypothetical protein [Paraflavitalea sp. CAU 1676]MDF2188584.1 hypothetical protein [Paraflavitalea sp. CAU 1676]